MGAFDPIGDILFLGLTLLILLTSFGFIALCSRLLENRE
jgi:hypothetical protein